MERLWRSREDSILNQGEVSSEISPADFPPLIRRLLHSRGLKEKLQVSKWLSPKLGDLRDPATLLDMQIGVTRLVQAFRVQEKICIYADFDLDGTSGLALLNDGLKQLGFQNLVLAQPKRLSEGYGFHSHIVEDLKAQGVSVIVTIDVGITAFQACEKAKELGVDVILTDHHQPSDRLPLALAVINPNRKDDTSKLGYLSGAGVAFYFLRALKRGLLEAGLISENALDLKSVLDCFCIATLTDMVPLVEDNRVLVKQGLVQLEHTKRAGLRALLEELDLSGRSLSSQDVAIRFAPKLNALSRMEMGILPIDLYLVEDLPTARNMVQTVLKNNSTRVQLQGAGESEALERLKTWPHEKFVFLTSKNFHKGVVGLIATKISLQKNVPAFIGAINEEGVITGSARLPQGFVNGLLGALESGREHLVRFGGHEAAAGFELHENQQEAFLEKLVQYFELQERQGQKCIDFDLEADLAEITENLMRWFEVMGPFGQSFENPVLCFRHVVLQDVIVLKGNHLKFKLQDREGQKKVDGIYFSPPPALLENLPAKGSLVDLLGELQWNYFSGRRSVQILLKDLKLSKGEG
ncbi:MAG: single-stranded-DNA-specific exonuclease RecJ [Pseudobdellovibrionaceae bacterium]